MADPTLRSLDSTAFTNANPHLAKKPAGLDVGDFMALLVNVWNGVESGTPDGWTKAVQSSTGANANVTIYTKVADAADVAASTFSVPNAGARFISSCTKAVTGVGSVGLLFAFYDPTPGTAHYPAVSYTPPAANSLIITGLCLPGAAWGGWAVNSTTQTSFCDFADSTYACARSGTFVWASGDITNIGWGTVTNTGPGSFASILLLGAGASGGGTCPLSLLHTHFYPPRGVIVHV